MQHSDSIQIHSPSLPWHIHTTLENVHQQSMNLLDKVKHQSQALHDLLAQSEELLVLMTHVVSQLDKLVPDQKPKLAPVYNLTPWQ